MTGQSYIGKRTTGTEAGDFLISGPDWRGSIPPGMGQILSPNDSVLVIGLCRKQQRSSDSI
jgi:hypothetical protein